MGQLTILSSNHTNYVASNVRIVKSEVEMICKDGVGDYFETIITEFTCRNWRKQRQTSESIARLQAEIINGTSRNEAATVTLCTAWPRVYTNIGCWVLLSAGYLNVNFGDWTNLKIYLKEINYDGGDWICLARDVDLIAVCLASWLSAFMNDFDPLT